MEFSILIALWLSTLIIGIAVEYLPKKAIWFLSFLSTLGVGAGVLYILQDYMNTTKSITTSLEFDHAIFPLKFGFTLDATSLLLISFALILVFFIYTFSAPSILKEENTKYYCLTVNLFLSVWVFMVASISLFQVTLGGTIISFLSYIMVTLHHKQRGAKSAAERVFYVYRLGDILFLFVVAGLFALYDSMDIRDISQLITAGNNPRITVITAIFAVSVAIQTGQFLFHFAPSDMAESPVSVLILSTGAGMGLFAIYMVTHFYPLLQQAPMILSSLKGWVVITITYVAIRSLLHFKIRRVMSDLINIQMGLLLLATLQGGKDGFYHHIILYMVAQISLYLFVRLVLYLTTNEQDIRAMGGLYRRGPITAVIALVYGIVATGGIFWLTYTPVGFLAIDGVLKGNGTIFVMLIVAVNTIAVVRFIAYIFLGQCRMAENSNAYITENYLMAGLAVGYVMIAVVLWVVYMHCDLFQSPVTFSETIKQSLIMGYILGFFVAILALPNKPDTGIAPTITPDEPKWISKIRHINVRISLSLWRRVERPTLYSPRYCIKVLLDDFYCWAINGDHPFRNAYLPMVVTVIVFIFIIIYGER